jgi:hypothetical protein
MPFVCPPLHSTDLAFVELLAHFFRSMNSQNIVEYCAFTLGLAFHRLISFPILFRASNTNSERKDKATPTNYRPMDSQSREDVAAQLRAWTASRFLPNDQIEQMVSAVRSGLYDDQILRARTTVPQHDQQQQQQQQQQQSFTYLTQPLFFNSHPPFNDFFPMLPMPAMPAMPAIPTIIPLIPNQVYPIPPTIVPSMFPTTALQNAATPMNQSSTTTNFPGGQSTQQTSSYAGQQGNTTFQYSSSNTSMSFNHPSLQFPPTMQHVFPAVAHPTHFMTPAPALQQQTLLHQPQPHHQHRQQPTRQSLPLHTHDLPIMRPRDHNPIQRTATPTVIQPDPLFNPILEEVVDQEPQNPRLAERFRQQLEADEATYFSPVPGRADRRVER